VTVALTDVGGRLGSARTARGEAELWFAWVGEHAGAVDRLSRDVLSTAEQTRLGRYRSRDAAERYVVTRSLVRMVLARRLGAEPRSVEVLRTDAGKPVIAGNVHFNVSHSADLVVMALSTDCDVGVDVERRREIDRVDQLRRRWLTEPEREEVDRLSSSGTSVSDAFLRIWTLKEARLKALGIGISGAALELRDIDVVSLDDALARLAGGDQARANYVGAIAFAPAR
jgi:4'-phosphopantetheinyl transferase